jgi:tripartite-type tricarboxylate transporter receptor subunit TctC
MSQLDQSRLSDVHFRTSQEHDRHQHFNMTHVPYKGSVPALTDVISGHISLMFADTIPSLPIIKAGKVRASRVLGNTVAFGTGNPTARGGWRSRIRRRGVGMIVAPAHTSAPILTKLAEAIHAVASRPDFREQTVRLGMVPKSSPPPEKLQDFINAEMVRWGQVVQAAELAGAE